MACRMAEGQQISLAPAALGHVYYGLSMAIQNSENDARAVFGMHFIIGWLARYFPALYNQRPGELVSEGAPLLALYAGYRGNILTIHEARGVIRHPDSADFRGVPFGDVTGSDQFSLASATPEEYERALSIRSGVLVVRLSFVKTLQPYYPNRFARQFGFDQAIPTNKLLLSPAARSKRTMADLAASYAYFSQKSSGDYFRIPSLSRVGRCTSGYCAWWIAATHSYLRLSLEKLHLFLTHEKINLKDAVCIPSFHRTFMEHSEGVVLYGRRSPSPVVVADDVPRPST